ncbi:phage tail protein [Xenorhabdus sp. Reich]|uniref:Phage tail protein n=1 Tax=Xenorhabdus littoralis TaxID=2582835 RepID=A0ABU4SLL4_9GAMM|nr:phage tail protein [Xenorhabdus sp. Reich]MDX7999435.1 phage tail protein [Xenorhabdus sp. Reich]
MSTQDSNNSVEVPTMDDVRRAIKEAIEEHAASRNHPYATQAEPGFVTLNNETDSDSEITVATSKAVKKAYELANTANQNAINSLMGGSSLPVGVPVPWPTEIPPQGWLMCNGEPFDKSKYPKLALAYPSGKLPDLRGEFIRGWDNKRGVDTLRKVLSWQQGSYLVQEVNNRIDNVVNFSINDRKNLNWDIPSEETQLRGRSSVSSAGTWSVPKNYVGVTRPRNIAFNYIVRAA